MDNTLKQSDGQYLVVNTLPPEVHQQKEILYKHRYWSQEITAKETAALSEHGNRLSSLFEAEIFFGTVYKAKSETMLAFYFNI